jgi:outer membrane protein
MCIRPVGLLLLMLVVAVPVVAQPARFNDAPPLLTAVGSARFASDPSEVLDLNRCLRLALEGGNRHKVADTDVEVAAARLGQARSSRYPEVSATLSGIRFDESPNFLFPAGQFTIPSFTISTGIPGYNFSTPAQSLSTPAQDVKLMDRNLLVGTLDATYALYTGGLAGARIAQAKAGVEAARQERRLTDAQVTFDVRRAYYGVILARKLLTVAHDTLVRMEATLTLTQSIYETGSGRVKKTDFLRNRSMVETIRSMVVELESQEQTARVALAIAVGWDRATPFVVADTEFPVPAAMAGTASLLADALTSNPRLSMIKFGLDAASSEVTAARSGHLPKVGLFAQFRQVGNSYDAGIVTPDNTTAWNVGVGVAVPIFQGFRVVKAVDEARARRTKLELQLSLARDGVEFELRQTRLVIEKATNQQKATGEAYATSIENRELNIRAYQDELVETKDVIEAQLMEALLAAQHFRVQYERAEATARLDLILGVSTPSADQR